MCTVHSRLPKGRPRAMTGTRTNEPVPILFGTAREGIGPPAFLQRSGLSWRQRRDRGNTEAHGQALSGDRQDGQRAASTAGSSRIGTTGQLWGANFAM